MDELDKEPYPPNDILANKLQENPTDTESQCLLVSRFKDPLLRHIKKWVFNLHDAEEVLFDTFNQIILKIDTYRPKIGPFKAWCFAIAEHKAIDWARKVEVQSQKLTVISLENVKYRLSSLNEASDELTVNSDELNISSEEDSEQEQNILDNCAEIDEKALVTKFELLNEEDNNRSEIIMRIKQFINNELTDRQKLLISLKWERGLPWNQIAEILVPELYSSLGSIYTDHHRIKERLKIILKSSFENNI